MIIVPYNHHDDAELEIDGVTPDTAPVTNTQNTIRGEVWRNPDTDAIAIVGNLPQARPFNFFGFFGHRTHGADVQLELFSAIDLGGSLLHDTTALDTMSPWTADTSTYDWGGTLGHDPHLRDAPYWIYLPDTFDVVSYRISFTNFAGTGTVWPGGDAWQVGRIWLGSYFEPWGGPAFGAQFGTEAAGVDSLRSPGGSLRVSEGSKYRTAILDLHKIRGGELRFWRDMEKLIGYSRDFVISLYHGDENIEERDHTMLCKFSALNALNRQANVSSKRLQIQEV